MIGIFCRRPKDYYLFSNLYEELNGDAEFIAAPTYFPKTSLKEYEMQSKAEIDPIINFLKTKKVKYKIAPIVLQRDRNRHEIEKIFRNFELLIDSQNSIYLLHPANITKKKILYFYDDFIAGFWPPVSFAHIDIVLAPGNYFFSLLSPFIKTEIVGNLYLDKPEIPGPERAGITYDKNKKTILFLPHESSLWSPASFSGAVNELSQDFNVLVQFLEEGNTRDKSKNLFSLNPGVKILEPTYDIRAFAQNLDIIITDDSMTSLEWLAMQRSVILLDSWTKTFFTQRETELPDKFRYQSMEFSVAHDSTELTDIIRKISGKKLAEIHLQNKVFNFFDRQKEPPSRSAANLIKDVLSGKRVKEAPQPFSSLIFKPGDVVMKNYASAALNSRLNPLLGDLEDILKEVSVFQKYKKVINLFFK